MQRPLAAPALTLSDQTGWQVSLPAWPRRIIFLVPRVTETVFAAGAQDLLVGVTDFCDDPSRSLWPLLGA